MSDDIRSLPLATEIIVSIAYRFKGAEFAEPRGFIKKWPVRTPAEIERAAEEVEAAMWAGTLQSYHELASPVAPSPAPGATT